MRKVIVGFCWIAAVSPAWAQTPAGAAVNKNAVQQVNHNCDAACPEACPHKVCVSVPTTKKNTKVVYGSRCIEYCLQKCTLGHGCDDDCADNCGRVRTKNVLLKKVITEECPATKCEVALAPPCPTACSPRTTSTIMMPAGQPVATPSPATQPLASDRQPQLAAPALTIQEVR